MTEKEKKDNRFEEVEILLADFYEQRFDEELKSYVLKLWEKLSKKRNYSITRGKKEIWASSVIYVIARLNFLFDKKNEYSLTADTICDFFGTNKNTVSARATEIEKAVNIRMGEKEFCRSDIHDSLTVVQLSNGMLITKSMAREMGFIIE
ncbi:MAG: DUF6398 domain-containing protein [Verrucomicrobia bacterium]|nr:DUF6398 domain-containing protein [Verrucomicrobiota bacterium]